MPIAILDKTSILDTYLTDDDMLRTKTPVMTKHHAKLMRQLGLPINHLHSPTSHRRLDEIHEFLTAVANGSLVVMERGGICTSHGKAVLVCHVDGKYCSDYISVENG